MNIRNNKLLGLLMVLSCTFVYLLNFFNKISECSLVFILLAFTTNIIAELYGKKISLMGLLAGIVISSCLLWNFNYYIHSIVIQGLVLASFASLLVSIYFSTSVLLYLKLKFSFNARNFISLAIASIVDGIIMSGFFINKFSGHRVIAIFCEEILFKCLYSLLIYSIIFFAVYVIKKTYIKNKI